jgi:hypothetical protein
MRCKVPACLWGERIWPGYQHLIAETGSSAKQRHEHELEHEHTGLSYALNDLYFRNVVSYRYEMFF